MSNSFFESLIYSLRDLYGDKTDKQETPASSAPEDVRKDLIRSENEGYSVMYASQKKAKVKATQRKIKSVKKARKKKNKRFNADDATIEDILL